MSDKKDITKSISISPESARKVDFSQQTTNFKDLLDKEIELTERQEVLDEEIQKLFEPYCNEDESILSYAGSVDSTYIYKKREVVSEDVKQLSKIYGNTIQNITSQNQLSKMITKVIGQQAFDKLKAVSDYYYNVKEVDEQETKKVRTKLAVILKEQSQTNRKLNLISGKKAQSKEYVSYVKDVASIAASTKELNG